MLINSPLPPRFWKSLPLDRSLTPIETWGYGLVGGPAGWLGLIMAIHLGLGASAIWVWLPATAIGILINLQVKQLAQDDPDVVGGTPNYLARLLHHTPLLARYGSIGYILNWLAAYALCASQIGDLINTNLPGLAAHVPAWGSKLLFMLLPAIVAFSGTRALSLLHLLVATIAFVLLALFSVQGLAWLSFSPQSPGFWPDVWPSGLSGGDWAKWFFLLTYATYSCETAATFVGDSRDPQKTLKVLHGTIVFMPIVFIGASWVVSRVVTESGLPDDVFSLLVKTATPFWGEWASIGITTLIATADLVVQATALALVSRALYQLAQDDLMAPVFSIASKRGVFGPGILLSLICSGCFLWWGSVDVGRLIVAGNVAWFVAFMLLHWGFWRQFRQRRSGLAWLSLGVFGLEVIVLWIGVTAWGIVPSAIGFVLPFGLMAIDGVIRRASVGFTQPEWWYARYQSPHKPLVQDSLLAQVLVLMGLMGMAVVAGWMVRSLSIGAGAGVWNGLVLTMLVVIVLGVAIACWTSLSSVMQLAESEANFRKEAQQLAAQLIQQEKMSSLSQVVAGVAHEINNPISFIHGNLKYVNEYSTTLLDLLQTYVEEYPHPSTALADRLADVDLGFIAQDLPKIISSMNMGSARIRDIILSLRTFSRLDEADWKSVNLQADLDSTLLLLQHRLNQSTPPIVIQSNYGDLPLVQCSPAQINQSLMNILTNAIEALELAIVDHPAFQPAITITTQTLPNQWISITIADNAGGIPESIQGNIFDPFFTTKPIGKGPGLGLTLSYRIVEQHQGRLTYQAVPGGGSQFTIALPISRPSAA
jgi:signal transduction histidine kinase